jgi:hypothetical protein
MMLSAVHHYLPPQGLGFVSRVLDHPGIGEAIIMWFTAKYHIYLGYTAQKSVLDGCIPLPAMLAWMVASKFILNAAIQFKLGCQAIE